MSRIGDEQRNQVFTDVENYIKLYHVFREV